MGSINDFTANISKSGVALSSEYEVDFYLPQKVKAHLLQQQVDDNMITDVAKFRASITELPSRQLQVLEDRSLNNGIARRIPTSMVYTELNMSLLLSEDMRERVLIEEWQNYIIGGNSNSNSMPTWRNRYYEDFTKESFIEIHIKSQVAEITDTKSKWFGIIKHDTMKANTLYTIRLHEVFPVSIGQVNLDWSNDNPMMLPITFQYRYWTKEKYKKQNLPGRGFVLSTNLKALQQRAIDNLLK